MSWTQYTEHLRANNVCEQAHIFNKADFSVVTSSDATMEANKAVKIILSNLAPILRAKGSIC